MDKSEAIGTLKRVVRHVANTDITTDSEDQTLERLLAILAETPERIFAVGQPTLLYEAGVVDVIECMYTEGFFSEGRANESDEKTAARAWLARYGIKSFEQVQAAGIKNDYMLHSLEGIFNKS